MSLSVVRTAQRNVKRWRDGEMALRWTAAGMLEAERSFRRIIGYRDLAKLAIAVDGRSLPRCLAASGGGAGRRWPRPLPCDRSQPRIAVKVPRRSGHARGLA